MWAGEAGSSLSYLRQKYPQKALLQHSPFGWHFLGAGLHASCCPARGSVRSAAGARVCRAPRANQRVGSCCSAT